MDEKNGQGWYGSEGYLEQWLQYLDEPATVRAK